MLLLITKLKDWASSFWDYLKRTDKKKLILILLIPVVIWVFKGVFKAIYEKIKNMFLSSGSTLSDESADILVSNLKQAFSNVLDNTKEVSNILKDLSTQDYYRLKDRFGIVYRSYLTGAPATGFQANSIFSADLNLTEWLSIELGHEGVKEVKSVNPNLPI